MRNEYTVNIEKYSDQGFSGVKGELNIIPIKCITLETVIHNCMVRVSENPRLDSIDALKSIAAKSLSEYILSYMSYRKVDTNGDPRIRPGVIFEVATINNKDMVKLKKLTRVHGQLTRDYEELQYYYNLQAKELETAKAQIEVDSAYIVKLRKAYAIVTLSLIALNIAQFIY